MSNFTLKSDLPEASVLFYRSRFEIFPDDDIHAEVWPQVLRVLQNWLEGKEGGRDDHGKPNLHRFLTNDVVNYSSNFDVTYQDCYLSQSFANGTLESGCESSYLETERCEGKGTSLVPQFWAFDYIERDSSKPFRRWKTNVGVTSSTSGTYVVNVRVSIHDDATFMGQAEIPERNTPNFISDMLNIKNCVTIAGDIELSNNPISLTADNIMGFIDDLESPNRTIPIVGISAHRDGRENRFDIDAEAFAKKMAGSAVIYTLNLEDYNLRRMYRELFLDNECTKLFRIPNGGIRVFLPGVQLQDQNDSYRHRFYTYGQLQNCSLAQVSDNICISISRLYQKKPEEVIDSASVRAQENRTLRKELAVKYKTLKAERNKLAHATNKANTSDFESLKIENKSLWEEIERLEDEHDFFEKYIDALESSHKDETEELQLRVRELQQENDRLDSKADHLQHNFDTLQEKFAEIKTESDALRRRNDLWEARHAFPTTPLEALLFAESLYGDRIIILDEAKDSAEEFDGDAGEVFQIIKSIHSHLWQLLFESGQSVDVDGKFYAATGFEVTFRETKTTQNDSKLMRQRTRSYDGRDIDITPHVKGKSGPRNGTLRVHFYKDNNKNMIVIGHCGEHLDTAGTRRKK